MPGDTTKKWKLPTPGYFCTNALWEPPSRETPTDCVMVDLEVHASTMVASRSRSSRLRLLGNNNFGGEEQTSNRGSVEQS